MKAMVVILSVFCLTALVASAEPPSAEQVLAEAKTKAAAEHKAIFVHFGASWCGWCRKFDAFLDQPDVKVVFEKYFVPVKLVVQESEKNKALENSGAGAVLMRAGGFIGLPFSAFLDAEGALIVNSNSPAAAGTPGGNIGYPSAPAEIDWFMEMIKKAAPKISADDLKTIETALRNAKTN